MVFVNGKKYACETCIKGHRSSSCKHTDRPLYEIKKKGRPVTQCEHCRELRKTKQVHVKCLCESKGDHLSDAVGGNKVSELPAFPNGLPEALEMLAVLPSSEGASSDSEHTGCVCFSKGGTCNCCSTRKAPSKSKRRPQLDALGEKSSMNGQAEFDHPSRILARIAELRPVLPRPSSNGSSGSGPLHKPSTGATHGHAGRHHEDVYYSPYGRAYDRTHYQAPSTDYTPSAQSNNGYPLQDQAWLTPPDSGSAVFPALCQCQNCQCPNCVYHQGSGAGLSSSAFSTCTEPSMCSTCLDCTILSAPLLENGEAPFTFDEFQTGEIDEWLRQVSSPLPNALPTLAIEGDQSPIPFQENMYTYGDGRLEASSPTQFLDVTDDALTRRRSASTCSQSSRRSGAPVFEDGYLGSRSAPQLHAPQPFLAVPSRGQPTMPYAVSSGIRSPVQDQYDSSLDDFRI